MKRKNTDTNLKQEIIESQNAIRSKYKKLKSEKILNDEVLKNTFETISTPLNRMVKMQESSNDDKKIKNPDNKYDEEEMDYSDSDEDSTAISDVESEIQYNFSTPAMEKTATPLQRQGDRVNKIDAAKPYFLLHLDKSKEDLLDKVYGIRSDGIRWLLGNSAIKINNDKVVVANKTYNTTPGLLELLFMKIPSDKKFTQADLKMYKEMVLDTSAHKKHYEVFKPINSNRGFKYLNIIRKLFNTQGTGMSITSPIYERWNDPNELVDRLKILIASQSAGNSSVGNEILSIIEELREENIIV
jgi:hypothetical protein